MQRTVVTGANTKMVFENRIEDAIRECNDVVERVLVNAGSQIADEARKMGDYTNRTGNLRRMVTPNFEHASDDPKTYPSHMLTYEDIDGKLVHRPQYQPPSEFDQPKIEVRGNSLVLTIANIMWYAAALEAKGYAVLSRAFNAVVANPKRYLNDTGGFWNAVRGNWSGTDKTHRLDKEQRETVIY